MGFELNRTVSNLIELEHTKKTGKRPQKPYELRSMVEVDRTRTNFDAIFRGGRMTAERKRTKSPKDYASRLTGEE